MSVDSNDVLQALENADEDEKREIQMALGIKEGHTRRDVLKGAAAVGGGAAIGAGAASEMTGEAKADPSTSDSDGNVGLPGDRVDVFAEGIDSNSVDTGEINNEYTASPSDTISSVISDLVADHGHGAVRLLPGDHTVDSEVSIPEGVTVYAPNPNQESGGRVKVSPSADHGVFRVKTGSSNRAAGQLSGVFVDAPITNYSSAAVTVEIGTNEAPRWPLVEQTSINVSNDGAGSRALLFDADTNDTGTGYLKVRDIDILAADTCVHAKATTANAYINGLHLLNLYMRGGSTQMIRQEGSIGSPYYDIQAQVSANTGKLIQADSDFSMDIHSYDKANSATFPAGKFIDLSQANINKPVQITAHRSGSNMLRGVVSTEPVHMTEADRRRWEIENTGLPHWLTHSGTGSISISTGRITISTSATSGESHRLRTAELYGGSTLSPSMEWTGIASGTNLVSNVGYRNPNGNFEAMFYYDPGDTLATGITSNYIFRVVDTDGTEVLAEDTGIATGSRENLSVAVPNGEAAFGGANGTSTTTLQPLSSTVSDFQWEARVETQESASHEHVLDFAIEQQTVK